jgi:hypothetical protein
MDSGCAAAPAATPATTVGHAAAILHHQVLALYAVSGGICCFGRIDAVCRQSDSCQGCIWCLVKFKHQAVLLAATAFAYSHHRASAMQSSRNILRIVHTDHMHSFAAIAFSYPATPPSLTRHPPRLPLSHHLACCVSQCMVISMLFCRFALTEYTATSRSLRPCNTSPSSNVVHVWQSYTYVIGYVSLQRRRPLNINPVVAHLQLQAVNQLIRAERRGQIIFVAQHQQRDADQ